MADRRPVLSTLWCQFRWMMVKTRSPVALDKRLDDDYQRVFVGVCVCGEGWSDGVGGDGPAAGVGPGPAGGVGGQDPCAGPGEQPWPAADLCQK